MFDNKTIQAVQLKILPGKIQQNARAMMEHIKEAQKKQIDILVFPSCSLTGENIGSYLFQEEFWNEANYWRNQIIECAQDLILVFGDAINNHYSLEKVIVVSENSRVVAPDLDGFYSLQGGSVGFHVLQSKELPKTCHSKNLIVLANQVFQKEQAFDFDNLESLLETSFSHVLWLNAVGIEDMGSIVRLYAGASRLLFQGKQVQIAPYFEEAAITFSTALSPKAVEKPAPIALLYSALSFSAKYYLEHLGLSKMIVGLSGGIDSAISACIYRSILPPENLFLVNMPSQFNSDTTKGIAAHIAKHLNAWYAVLPIEEAVQSTIAQFNSSSFTRSGSEDLTIHLSELNIENLQARIRSNRILASVASSIGGVFTCNANKSESTVGYGTLCGDDAGFFSLIGDLWKNEIYELASYINTLPEFHNALPKELFTTPPSAELSAKQNVDEGLGDPIHYAYHDKLFSAFCERLPNATPYTILKWYNDHSLTDNLGVPTDLIDHLFPTAQDFITDLEYWWKQYTGLSVAKRIQSPPTLSLSPRTFGSFPESQIAWTPTHSYNELKAMILKKGDS